MMIRKLGILALLLLSGSATASNPDDIELAGIGTVPGNLSDQSGLTANICNADNTQCIPQNLLGGFGSGIAYTGFGDQFVTVSDRGPFDGLTNIPYKDRFHTLRFKLDTSSKTISSTLLDTRLFRNLFQNFVGLTSAFDVNNPSNTLRFDPEAVRVSRFGQLFVSDEYGPYVYKFNRLGFLLHRIRVPERFLIDNPNAIGTEELKNTKGRQSNRGMEGLAISPDGRLLFGLMQNPLLQDGALNASLSRRGINSRLLKIDLLTGVTQEFVYQIEQAEGANNGMNEIVAVNDWEFLVVERDGRLGNAALTKKIYHIGLHGATDVSNIEKLPQTCIAGTDCPFTPVKKTLLIDMLEPKFGLKGSNFPEKIEGLAFGPDLRDGRHVLYVSSDNDLNPANPTYIYAFAIPRQKLPNFRPQETLGSFLSSLLSDHWDDWDNIRSYANR